MKEVLVEVKSVEVSTFNNFLQRIERLNKKKKFTVKFKTAKLKRVNLSFFTKPKGSLFSDLVSFVRDELVSCDKYHKLRLTKDLTEVQLEFTDFSS